MVAVDAVRSDISDKGNFGPTIGRIPVRNIWLLMLYASELFRVRDAGTLGVEETPDDIPELVAEILAFEVEQRIRRRLTLGYQTRTANVNRVRGRIDLLATERDQLLSRGSIACRFSELTIDTPRNRFVRSALESIARLISKRPLAHRCRVLASGLRAQGVVGVMPTRTEMSVSRYTLNDAHDRLMIAAATLAVDLALPVEGAATHLQSMAERDEIWARKLFEQAVGGFYEVVLAATDWRVRRGTHLGWQASAQTAGVEAILPSMRTDIILENLQVARRIIVDTKFTSILTKGWHREESLRSGYLYQMYAYVRSQEDGGDPLAEHVDGLLLHPAIGTSIDECVVIQGHAIRFATVDLAAPAAEFRGQLLRLLVPSVMLELPASMTT